MKMGNTGNTMLIKFKIKRIRFDKKSTLPVLCFVPMNNLILTPSYKVTYLNTKQGKPHTTGETVVKPAVLKMANIILRKASDDKLT